MESEMLNHLLKKQTGPWPYLRHWLLLTIAAETWMLFFNQRLVLFYSGISLLFFGGLFLRVVKLYPGRPEPLILDFSGALIGLVFTFLARVVNESGLRFLLILCSSAIIMPHIFYLLSASDTS